MKAKLVVRMVDRSLRTVECEMAKDAINVEEAVDYSLIANDIGRDKVKIAQYEVEGEVKFVFVPKDIGNYKSAWIVGVPTTRAAKRGSSK